MEVRETIGCQDLTVSHPFSLHRRTSTDRYPDRKQASNLDARQTLGLAHHFETSLRIPSSLNSRDELSKVHSILAALCLEEDKLSDAHIHVERARLHAGNDMLQLGRVCGVYKTGLRRQSRIHCALPLYVGNLGL